MPKAVSVPECVVGRFMKVVYPEMESVAVRSIV
jgi:hypothetical protein